MEQLGAKGFIDRSEFAGMMRRGGETPEEEKARFAVTRDFAKRVKAILGDAPDIVFEHVGKATFPTSVFTVKPFGKVVICGATSGYDLDFDVRYLWMRQKQIIGSHFANAWECKLANRLIEERKVRPVLWRTMGFDQVAEAHQLMHENKHLGQDRHPRRRHRGGPGPHGRGPRRHPRGGRRLMAGVVHIPWYATGFRHHKLADALADIAPIALRYGARSYAVYRSRDDLYKFLQIAEFEHKRDWERYWNGPEFTDFRVLTLELVPGAGPLRLDRRRRLRARSSPSRSVTRPTAYPAASWPARRARGARASARCPSAIARATGG